MQDPSHEALPLQTAERLPPLSHIRQTPLEHSASKPRVTMLVATGRPGNLQMRLVDPATRNERPGLGACTGDSGGPAFVEDKGKLAIAGVISWSTGAKGEAGCGGLTGVTPIWLHRGWVFEQAGKMGSTIAP